MTEGPVDWMEDALENDLIDLENTSASDYFDNWGSFAQGTQSELEELFEDAREGAIEASEEEREEGLGPEEPGKSGTY